MQFIIYQLADTDDVVMSWVPRINATVRQQRGVPGVETGLPTQTVRFRNRPQVTAVAANTVALTRTS
jgi:hypothetical protein